MKTQAKVEDGAEVSTGYTPRHHQLGLHEKLARFSVVICHRRFGKSVFAANHLINEALQCKKPRPQYAYIAPTYAQVKRIVWQYIKEFTQDIPGVSYNEAELRCDFAHNGAKIMLLSAENYAGLKGIYLDFCVLDEYGDMNPSAWREAVRPTLSDRAGGALFIGTVKGTNHFWEMYEHAKAGSDPEWFTAMYKASDTGIIPEAELKSLKAGMTEQEYMQEMECDPLAGLVGAYFSREMSNAEKEGRIGRVPYDPALAVDTYWDLGINDKTSIWFVQTVRGKHHVVRYEEYDGHAIPDLVKKLQEMKYVYGEFVLPHDAKVRDLSTGKSRVQTFYNLGCRRVRVIPRVGTKMEGINAARMIMPKCYFDRASCLFGIKALQNYQKKFDSKNNVFADSPLHNWASNAADAFQQFGLGCRDDSRDSGMEHDNRSGSGQTEAEMDYNPYGMRGR